MILEQYTVPIFMQERCDQIKGHALEKRLILPTVPISFS